jgi:surface carbohydrate biosynthesis protein
VSVRAIARLLRLGLLRGTWRAPRRADYLLYFADGRELLEPLVPAGALEVCDMRERSINLRVQLACLARGRTSAAAYGDEWIRRVRPRVVVTCIDNYWQFFELKARFPAITFVTIQNGVRGPSDDLFGHFADEAPADRPVRRADHMLVYGPAVGRELARYVGGTIHAVGSVRSNAVRRRGAASTPPRRITYVSTWRSTVRSDQRIAVHGGGRHVTIAEIYARRDAVVRWLLGYCDRHGLRLLVAGKDEDPAAERTHFDGVLGTGGYDLLPRIAWSSGYETVDRGDLVVFTSSSLGYEALGRGRRTAALFTDVELTGSVGERFGWPLELPDDGPFWTHRYDESRFAEILDRLRLADDDAWWRSSSSVIAELMRVDDDNATLRAILRESVATPVGA